MKKACGVLAAAFILVSALAAQAAEYQSFSDAKPWRSEFLQWLSKFKPAPEAITVGISGSTIHAYLIPGSFGGTYTVQRMQHPQNGPNNAIKAILDGGTGKILGFIDNRIYILTWTKAGP
jgi:hypothetical protein